IKENGFYAMITQHSWMFLSSYENLRKKLMFKSTVNMAHLGARAFDEIGGEVVQTTAFVNCGRKFADYIGTYARLVDVVGENEKRELFLSGKNRYVVKKEKLFKIPSMPVAYWVSENFVKAFEDGRLLGEIADSKQGIATADNNTFLREWFEVDVRKIFFDCPTHEASKISSAKWYPYNKGGGFRKWYGNNDYIVNWQHDGFKLRNFKKSVIRNPNFYFKSCFSWSLISSNVPAFRYKPVGHIFDVAGMSCFSDNNLLYLLALCNSNFVIKVLEVVAPTINYQCGDIANIPVLFPESGKIRENVEYIVQRNIHICKQDWNAFETSWDFEQHPLI
ncbi:MAG TPA: SAM-dependent methyltransferase, partial [Ruminococcus sp.]|nr:SAM-dependent methyltransferase [Ruminococcus sp.]